MMNIIFHVQLYKRLLVNADQRLALEWIQNNIKAFGGDKVTIFGYFIKD